MDGFMDRLQEALADVAWPSVVYVNNIRYERTLTCRSRAGEITYAVYAAADGTELEVGR